MDLLRKVRCVSEVVSPDSDWTTLHFAALRNNSSAIDQQMENGADIDTRTGEGETPLHIACLFGESECIEAILRYNPSMNVAEKTEGLTPLIILVSYLNHRTSTLRIMLEMGADPNLSQTDGNTPLHIIAIARPSNRRRAIKYAVELIKFKANVDAQNNHGDTPLHLAIMTGFTEIVRILLKNGAYLKIRNRAGINPIEYALYTRMIFSGPFIEIGQYIIEETIIGKLVVDQEDLEEFLKMSKLQLFKVICDEEASDLKSSVTNRTFVSYYDFLVLPLEVVCKFLRNEDILEAVMAFDETKYIFGKRLSKIFQDALSRNEAIDTGYDFLRRFAPVILPDLCMDVICKHLTNNDLWKLKNFICT